MTVDPYPTPIPAGHDTPPEIQRWVCWADPLVGQTVRYYQLDSLGLWRIRRNGVRTAMVCKVESALIYITNLNLQPVWSKSMRVRKGL